MHACCFALVCLHVYQRWRSCWWCGVCCPLWSCVRSAAWSKGSSAVWGFSWMDTPSRLQAPSKPKRRPVAKPSIHLLWRQRFANQEQVCVFLKLFSSSFWHFFVTTEERYQTSFFHLTFFPQMRLVQPKQSNSTLPRDPSPVLRRSMERKERKMPFPAHWQMWHAVWSTRDKVNNQHCLFTYICAQCILDIVSYHMKIWSILILTLN